MNLLEPLAVDMGVYLGGGDVGMAEHHLDGTEVGPLFKKVGREGMAQHMR